MKTRDTSFKPIIIAHRCNGFDYKENSMPALKAALQSKVDAVEIDIRLTNDLQWIVIHNPHFKNEKKQVERVHEKKYDEIKNDAILLEQMLFAISRSNKDLFLDVKDSGEEKQLVDLLYKYKMIDRTIIISWEPQVLRRTYALNKNIKLGFCYVPIHRVFKFIQLEVRDPISAHRGLAAFNNEQTFDPKSMKGYTRQHYLSKIPELGVPLFAIIVYAPFCSTKLVNLAHERKIKVFPFTIDTKVSYALFKLRMVDGIITNKSNKFTKK